MAQNFNLGLLGQYINVTTSSVTYTSNTNFSANIAIANSITLTANGSVGTPGQVLASNGTGLYWTNTVVSGALTINTLAASAITVDIGDITVGNNSSNSYISNTNIIVSNSAGFSANISTSSIRIGNAVSNSIITSTFTLTE